MNNCPHCGEASWIEGEGCEYGCHRVAEFQSVDHAQRQTITAQAARIAELEAALADVRHEICLGPVDDTLWHQEIPAETTVDFICNTLRDKWDYDQWLGENAPINKEPKP